MQCPRRGLGGRLAEHQCDPCYRGAYAVGQNAEELTVQQEVDLISPPVNGEVVHPRRRRREELSIIDP